MLRNGIFVILNLLNESESFINSYTYIYIYIYIYIETVTEKVYEKVKELHLSKEYSTSKIR